jgi:hypothetical protein
MGLRLQCEARQQAVRARSPRQRLMRCLTIRVVPQLTISVDPSAEAGIFGDAQRLSQVVSNLLRCSPRPVYFPAQRPQRNG